MKHGRILSQAAVGVAIIAGGLASADGAPFVYSFGSVFGGSAPASLSRPWIRAEFLDVSPGEVQMTIAAANLTGMENVKSFYLNLDPALNPSQLGFTPISRSGTFAGPEVSGAANAFKADGGGDYDVLVQFASGMGGSHLFGAGDQVTFLVTGAVGLTAASFGFPGLPGPQGAFFAAAHVQRIGSHDASGWLYPGDGLVPVPEPSMIALTGLGAGIMGLRWIRGGNDRSVKRARKRDGC